MLELTLCYMYLGLCYIIFAIWEGDHLLHVYREDNTKSKIYPSKTILELQYAKLVFCEVFWLFLCIFIFHNSYPRTYSRHMASKYDTYEGFVLTAHINVVNLGFLWFRKLHVESISETHRGGYSNWSIQLAIRDFVRISKLGENRSEYCLFWGFLRHWWWVLQELKRYSSIHRRR